MKGAKYVNSTGLIGAKADAATQVFGVKWKRFSTHVAYTENKTVSDKYIKVGGNSVMYGSLQRFSRSVAVENMKKELEPVVEALKVVSDEAGINVNGREWIVRMDFAVHKGYGQVALRRSKKGWLFGGGDDATTANWDIDNQWIWMKVFLDACQRGELIDNDKVTRIAGEYKRFKEVPTFADRYINFVFIPADLFEKG